MNGKNGGAPGTRTPDTMIGATVFKTASSTDRTRSFCGKWLPSVDLHHDDPVNSRACCFDMTGDGPSARFCAAVFHLSNGCSAIELRRMIQKNGRAPRCCPGYLLAPNEAGLLTPSRAMLKLAACAGIAPATFRSTGGCSSWLS